MDIRSQTPPMNRVWPRVVQQDERFFPKCLSSNYEQVSVCGPMGMPPSPINNTQTRVITGLMPACLGCSVLSLFSRLPWFLQSVALHHWIRERLMTPATRHQVFLVYSAELQLKHKLTKDSRQRKLMQIRCWKMKNTLPQKYSHMNWFQINIVFLNGETLNEIYILYFLPLPISHDYQDR